MGNGLSFSSLALTAAPRGVVHPNCIYCWKFSVSEDNPVYVSCTPVDFTSSHSLSPLESYICLRVREQNSGEKQNVDNSSSLRSEAPSLLALAQSCKDNMTPRGLRSAFASSPLVFRMKDVTSSGKALSLFDVFVYHGRKCVTLVKAKTLSTAFELERAILRGSFTVSSSADCKRFRSTFLSDIPSLYEAPPETLLLFREVFLVGDLLASEEQSMSLEESELQDIIPSTHEGEATSAQSSNEMQASPIASPVGMEESEDVQKPSPLSLGLRLRVPMEGESKDENDAKRLKYDEGSDSIDEGEKMLRLRDKKLREAEDECTRIEDWLYIAGGGAAMNHTLLKQMRITHVVNAAPMVYTKKYPEDMNISTFYAWMVDSSDVDMESLLVPVLDFCLSAKEKGGRVCIHCHQGVSRSCALGIVCIMYVKRYSFEQAAAYVKERRLVCSPNAGFIGQLINFEQVLGIRGSTSFPSLVFRASVYNTQYPAQGVVMRRILYEGNKSVKDCLEERGVFVVVFRTGLLFIWQGNLVTNSELLDTATTFANNLKKFKMYGCGRWDPVIVKGRSLSEGPPKKDEEIMFYEAIGGDGEIASSLRMYDGMDTSVLDGSSEKTEEQPSMEEQNESESSAPKEDNFMMFSLPDMEDFSLFDSEDLVEDGVFLVVNIEDGTAFVWRGEDSQDYSLSDSVKSTLKEKFSKEFSFYEVAQDCEPDDFWNCFVNG